MEAAALQRRRWLDWLIVCAAVSLTCAVAGRWLIFHLFGNGHHIALDTTGYSIIEFWDRSNGRFPVAGVVAFLALLARRHPIASAIPMAVVAAALTFAWEIAILVIYLSIHPGALD
jgi:hypothetical protein